MRGRPTVQTSEQGQQDLRKCPPQVRRACAGHDEGQGGASGSSRGVIRDERVEQSMSGAFIDWLSGCVKERDVAPADMLRILRMHMAGNLSGADRGRGWNGYRHRIDLYQDLQGETVQVGLIAYGGESQRGTLYFGLSGLGCAAISDWSALRVDLENLGAYLTRCDVAVDIYDGAWTVEDAVAAYEAGEFTAGGRRPSHDFRGDWLNPVKGRTFYVGRRQSGKMTRVYEKGKQLGDPDSLWNRVELELHNIDRTIPLDILTRPGDFLRGAYPLFGKLFKGAKAVIATTRKAVEVTLDAMKRWARRTVGKLLHVMLQEAQGDSAAVLGELVRVGVPRRLVMG